MAAMVYAGKIIKDLGLQGRLYFTGNRYGPGEDCDGLCWQHLIEKEGIRPELVVITEPTSCGFTAVTRGRMEIKVSVSGVSCHGSAPERGDNAIYKMAPILLELQDLHQRLIRDPFLGKGSLTVSEIFSSSRPVAPSPTGAGFPSIGASPPERHGNMRSDRFRNCPR